MMFGTGGSVQMELITSLASAAVLGRGSMMGFNNSIRTLRDLPAGGSEIVCNTWPGLAGLSPLACHSQTVLGLVMVALSSPLAISRSLILKK